MRIRFVIMHFGAMGRANGLDFLVDAARLCSDQPEILFVVIGSGGEKDRLKQRSETLQLNNIVFLDAVSKSDIAEWVAACDAATVIVADYSIMEHNSANKLFDALAAGKPVLLNYSGWQRDILEPHQAGAIPDPHKQPTDPSDPIPHRCPACSNLLFDLTKPANA